jgi:3-deoxy-manno-octulosonate cytidylyltransferase (CMP-KDO synthetase)
MKVLGIIPARYASSRFPGKPLAIIEDKPMIQHVFERSVKSDFLTEVYVATDDKRIEETVIKFGGKVMMTSDQNRSGTDRCMEALSILEKRGKNFDVVINIQGDEPFIHPEQINLLASCFNDPMVNIATLAIELKSEEDLFNPNIIKVVFDISKKALYFSRNPVPFVRNYDKKDWINKHRYFKHIGIYAFRPEILHQITHLNTSSLEQAESLEQLRWLENGYKIHVELTNLESIAVDTPDDLEKILNKLSELTHK